MTQQQKEVLNTELGEHVAIDGKIQGYTLKDVNFYQVKECFDKLLSLHSQDLKRKIEEMPTSTIVNRYGESTGVELVNKADVLALIEGK